MIPVSVCDPLAEIAITSSEHKSWYVNEHTLSLNMLIYSVILIDRVIYVKNDSYSNRQLLKWINSPEVAV